MDQFQALREDLKIDCKKCNGFCCVALYCSKSDGFPEDKKAGIPCKYLTDQFDCSIHSQLAQKKMKGCLAYDCFGAGQLATQSQKELQNTEQMFGKFLVCYQLRQMLWYLLDALQISKNNGWKSKIVPLLEENHKLTRQVFVSSYSLDLDPYRERVNRVLHAVADALQSPFKKLNIQKKSNLFGQDMRKKNFDGADLSMTLLIAANLGGCSFRYTNFLGADLRDANLSNADLSQSLFLTQGQINSAMGNRQTILPEWLARPVTWTD